ncbi:hypothetical protein [Streptomyces sp. NPDC023588]|uniref:hypothetical protein n=1 Tax=Streptomyces sp. NPDC023588 TaxID=3154907 RepID=UPI0033F8B759
MARRLASKDVEPLESFDEDYDQAGAGDALAAHLLASHHAAVGRAPDARGWRAFAHMLGFSNERHVPEPVHTQTVLAENFAVSTPWGQERQSFLLGFPKDLASR